MNNYTHNSLVFLIPMRSGSVGFKNKNIFKINGIPLYMYTINQVISFSNAEIFLSTDYNKSILKDLPKKVKYIKRSKALSSNRTQISEVVKDFILNNLKVKSTIVLLQVTSPFRLAEDIKNAINKFRSSKIELLMSVTKKNNSCLKYGLIEGDKFKPLHKIESCFSNRQSLPEVYSPNGMIYIFDSEWFLKNEGFVTNNIGYINIPHERSLDIDSENDIQTMLNKLN